MIVLNVGVFVVCLCVCFIGGYTAVSYTHLDVYKRQVLRVLMMLELFNLEKIVDGL